MPRSFILMFALVMALAGNASALAQEASPAAANASAIEPILRVSGPDLGSPARSIIGLIRTTYEAGADLPLSAEGGPLLLWMEKGSLAVDPRDGPGPLVVGAAAGTPVAHDDGEQFSLATGEALILPAGSAVQVRNSGTEPAVTLDLLSPSPEPMAPGDGVTRVVLAQREVSLPSPMTLALNRATIAPKAGFVPPTGAAETVLGTVDRAQTFMLSRNSVNRGTTPMPVYVLTITPLEGGVATPTT